MAKQPVDWLAIQARYLKGDKPKDIGADYGFTAKQISDKARNEGWVRKKAELFEKVAIATEDITTELCQKTDKVILKLLGKLDKAIDNVETGGSSELLKINGLLNATLNNATKIRSAYIKQAEPPQDEPKQIIDTEKIKNMSDHELNRIAGLFGE